MQTYLISSADYKTTAWSGGTTTEMFIYPQGSNFEAQDFLFRLSKADITEEKTTFNTLPHVKRCLMLLEGDLTLRHEGKPPRILERFDNELFTGDWNTQSEGKATVLNLMCKNEANGTLKKRVIRKVRLRSYWQENSLLPYRALAYYVYAGKIEVAIGQEIFTLEENDMFVLLPEEEEQTLRIHVLEKSIWVGVYIQ
jgi:environmental stress-induced protein Ves